jgi:hypothetical protein
LHGLHGNHRLLLSRIVLGVFTAPLHSNGRGADHTANRLSYCPGFFKADTCLLSRCLPMGIHVTISQNTYIFIVIAAKGSDPSFIALSRDLLTTYKLTTRDYNLRITDTQTIVLSLLQSPLAVLWQRILTQEL